MKYSSTLSLNVVGEQIRGVLMYDVVPLPQILLLKNLYGNFHLVSLGRHTMMWLFLLQLCVPNNGSAGRDVAACHAILRVSAGRNGRQQTSQRASS